MAIPLLVLFGLGHCLPSIARPPTTIVTGYDSVITPPPGLWDVDELARATSIAVPLNGQCASCYNQIMHLMLTPRQ